LEVGSKSLTQALKNRPLTKTIFKLKGLREHESRNLRKSESGYAVGCIGMEGIILKLRFDPIG